MPIFRNTPGLLQSFRDGSREAMATVYWAYVARVEMLVRRGFRLQDARSVPGVRAENLEDLVQEIFAKAFSERARLAFDGLRDYGPFLFTLARNVVVDWARKKGREVSLDELEGDVPDRAPLESEDEPWTDPETASAVSTYLKTLSRDLGDVHRERYVLGHTQRVAAAALGLSRQQLRTREAHLRAGLDTALRALGKK
jgi:RNA polymerase sigma-70 factor (ECF subfamily)